MALRLPERQVWTLGACEVRGAQLERSQEEARPGAAWPGCQGLRQAAWGPHPPEWTVATLTCPRHAL